MNHQQDVRREAEVDEETEREIAEGKRTRTGVPLPFVTLRWWRTVPYGFEVARRKDF